MTADPVALGEFLRARRAARDPRAAGLPGGGTRRTAGLRREELAALAGLSVDYLARLEQGRHRDPSPEVLAALASALGLDTDGRRHLSGLAGRAGPATVEVRRLAVPEAVGRLVERSSPSPAWLLNRVKDVLRWNRAAVELLGDPAGLPVAERNYVRMVFAPRHPWVAPDAVRADVLAHLRQTTAPAAGDPVVAGVVADLARDLPGFGALWAQQDVTRACRPVRMLDHPVLGRLTFGSELLDAQGGDLHLVVLEPADERTRELWPAFAAGAAGLRAV